MTDANADDYAVARQNIFFTANNQTPVDGNLTGQCVTLLKWFFQDMCIGFPVPFMARGNAKDVGRTLLAQGLATEVPYSDRRRGDVICYEYGLYGHIALQLSGGRIFEQNVKWSGVVVKFIDGVIVYASRIGLENEVWRTGKNAHVYRLKNYKEGESIPMWNDGQTYNLMYHCLTPAIAERAKAADFIGYFGLQGDGTWPVDVALDLIITSQQWGILKQEAFPSVGNVPSGTYLKINKSDIVET